MPRFPKSEAEIIVLCQAIIAGLSASGSFFTSPAFSPAELERQLDLFTTKRTDATASEAAFRLDVVEKDSELAKLIDMMKSVLRDAENKAKDNPAALQELSWGARAAATPLQPCQQPRTLEAPMQGDALVFLDWKDPIGGGAVGVYKILRRERPAGAWAEVASSFLSEITLINQPKGVELEYCVVASNRAGDSAPSNTVTVVL